jgi:hypothetical protein
MKYILVILKVSIILFLTGCGDEETYSSNTQIKNKPILMQPIFHYSKSGEIIMGKGFAVKNDGKVFIMTSAHLFYFYEGEKLSKISWTNLVDKKLLFDSNSSVGAIGKNAVWSPKIDLSSDYAIHDSIEKLPVSVLEIDNIVPKNQSDIWFPQTDHTKPIGFRVVSGYINSIQDKCMTGYLEENIKIRARSGSPVFSKKTNKVIGIISGGMLDDEDVGTHIYFTPIKYALSHLKVNQNLKRVPFK